MKSNQKNNYLLISLSLILIYIIIRIIISIIKYKTIISEYLDVKIDKEIIEIGKTHFKNSNVIICGLARDIEHRINDLQKNLDNIISCFNNHLILIVENDSSDNTRKKLLELKNKYNIFILGCGIDSKDKCIYNTTRTKGSGKNRMEKMANLRNIYISYINNMNKKDLEKYKYTIMFDCDLKTIINKKYLSSSGYYFNKYDYIDAIGCNGMRTYIPNNIYYDLYALDFVDKSIIPFGNRFESNFKSKKNITDLVKVNSCFAGFVIYKLNSIIGKSYNIEETFYGALCEHVPFNKNLKHVYINPKMLFPIFAHD